MGWRPWEVRASSLTDFTAAFHGWLRTQGLDPDAPGPMGRDELRDLMQRYPDETVH